VFVDALERRPPDLPQVWWTKRMREGTGKLVLRHEGNALERRQKPRRASALSRLRPGRVRISAGSNALESRGIVNFWFSEQEYAMPETTRGKRRREAYCSAEGKSSAG
jgi:hypothetical protein